MTHVRMGAPPTPVTELRQSSEAPATPRAWDRGGPGPGPPCESFQGEGRLLGSPQGLCCLRPKIICVLGACAEPQRHLGPPRRPTEAFCTFRPREHAFPSKFLWAGKAGGSRFLLDLLFLKKKKVVSNNQRPVFWGADPASPHLRGTLLTQEPMKGKKATLPCDRAGGCHLRRQAGRRDRAPASPPQSEEAQGPPVAPPQSQRHAAPTRLPHDTPVEPGDASRRHGTCVLRPQGTFLPADAKGILGYPDGHWQMGGPLTQRG